jgi:hypothetical protein
MPAGSDDALLLLLPALPALSTFPAQRAERNRRFSAPFVGAPFNPRKKVEMSAVGAVARLDGLLWLAARCRASDIRERFV